MFGKPHSYKVISFILVNTPVTAELNRNSLYNDRPIPDRDRKPPILFKIFITISLLMYDMKCKGGRLGMSLWDVLPTPLAFMANKVYSNQIKNIIKNDILFGIIVFSGPSVGQPLRPVKN